MVQPQLLLGPENDTHTKARLVTYPVTKYGQKVEVEKTADSALSHPVHHARKIFLEIGHCKTLSHGGLLLRGANFAGRYGDRSELR